MEADLQLRVVCFAALARLRAVHGGDVPYDGGLDPGLHVRRRTDPVHELPRKASFAHGGSAGPPRSGLMTSFKRPYTDEETDDGFWYAYRLGSIDQPDNRALRAAAEHRVPLAYYVGVKPRVLRGNCPDVCRRRRHVLQASLDWYPETSTFSANQSAATDPSRTTSDPQESERVDVAGCRLRARPPRLGHPAIQSMAATDNGLQ